MLKVTIVKAINDYKLKVELSDGRQGVFDMKPYINIGVFKQLKDRQYFDQVYPEFVGITWRTGQDLSADTIAHDLKEE